MQNNTGNKYSLSDSFEKFLAEISEGFLNSKEYDEVYSRIEINARKFFFDRSAESNLIRILSSLYDKKSFLIDSIKYNHHFEIVCAISSLSNYLTDIIVRNPEYLYLLFDQHFLTLKIEREELHNEISGQVSNFKTLQSKTRLLRNTKRKYLLKIGVADILGFSDLQTTVKQLSILADVLSSILLDVCYKEIQYKYGVELTDDYALCSLGKLGGSELNYSSDIDLILFYKENFEIPSIKKEYHEIISETLHLFIKESTAVTPESYLYRVDFRLRPDGRTSILCRSIVDYLKYYETRGEDWERQMLIKLGFVCGSRELFDNFKNYLDGYVYPKTLRSSAIETIKRIKRSIESRLSDDKNIKLIPGGIRDIEFVVQALQLMNGGKNHKLKTGNTLEALSGLLNSKLITENEFSHLNKAYMLYRNIEHFVQLMNDKQTHSLPQTLDVKEKMSLYLGFETIEQLESTVNTSRKHVRTIYESIIGTTTPGDSFEIDLINFSDKVRAKKNIEFLRYGISMIGEKQFDKRTIKLFQEVEPFLFVHLNNCNSPDLVLENFARLIKSSKFPSIWFSAFNDELFFKSFLNVCNFSQRAVDLTVSSSSKADLFLSKKVFHKIEQGGNTLSLSDLIYILSVQHVSGIISFPEFSAQLRTKIEQIIISIVAEFNIKYNFFLAGLGSFGNDELSFGSDIDLIVVTENDNDIQKAQKDFQNILTELRKNLYPFEVDFRLRPEGKSSPLVWDLSGYGKYINSRMRVWEFQALSKCRLVSGSKKLFGKFNQLVTKRLTTFDRAVINKEILEMYRSKLSYSSPNREKASIKSSAGGLLTVDTILSLLILSSVPHFQKLTGSNSLTKIKSLIPSIPEINPVKLEENYITLKNIQIGVQNLFNQSKSTMPNDKTKIELLAEYSGYENSEKFLNKLDNILKENITLLNNIKGVE